jgi:hypothetical protein
MSASEFELNINSIRYCSSLRYELHGPLIAPLQALRQLRKHAAAGEFSAKDSVECNTSINAVALGQVAAAALQAGRYEEASQRYTQQYDAARSAGDFLLQVLLATTHMTQLLHCCIAPATHCRAVGTMHGVYS